MTFAVYMMHGGQPVLIHGTGSIDPENPPVAALEYGSKPVGQITSYLPPNSNVIYVSPSGSNSNAGTEAAPKQTLAAAAVAATNGTTIVMRAGSYHEGSQLGAGVVVNAPNVTVQNYPGEEVWLDGSAVVTGWTADGADWRVPFVWSLDRSPTQVRGEQSSAQWGAFIMDTHPIAHWPECVFIDGVPLQQVQTRGEVGPGKFFVEGTIKGGTGVDKHLFTSSAYVIGTNPAGKEVRIGKWCRALTTTASASGFKVRGIGVRRYANTMPNWGCFYMEGPRPKFENVVWQDIADLGVHMTSTQGVEVRNCTFYRIGRKGIGGEGGTNSVIEWCHFERTNDKRFNYGPDGGAIKFRYSHDFTVRYNRFYDNRGHVVWFDGDCYDTAIHSNIFNKSYGNATFGELDYRFYVVDNIFIDNAIGSVDAWNEYRPHHDHVFRNVDTSDYYAWNNTVINTEVVLNVGISNRNRPVSNTNLGNNAFIGCAGLDSIQSCFVNTYDQNVTASLTGFDVRLKSNLYTRADSSHPARLANMYDAPNIAVYFNLDGAPSGVSKTTTWRQLTGETGVYQTVPEATVVDRATGRIKSTYGVTPSTPPAKVAELLAQSIFTPQPIGAGHL